MFCELFNHPPAVTVAAEETRQKKPKKKREQHPKPATVEQISSGPFTLKREKSPEPAPIPALDYEYLEEEDDWVQEEHEDFEEECHESDAETYDCTSMTMSEEDPGIYGSVESSPGMYFGHRNVVVEKKRPPGIALCFDDDSWID